VGEVGDYRKLRVYHTNVMKRGKKYRAIAEKVEGNKLYALDEAIALVKEGDGAELAKINQFNKAVKAEITEGMAEDYRTVEQLFINNPKAKFHPINIVIKGII
jgi:hypothetical protein